MNDLEILKIGAKAKVYDFAKRVVPVYKLLNWRWASAGIPNEDVIAETLKRLINNLDDNHDNWSTGGLAVEKMYWDDGKLDGLTIKMEISSDIYLGELK